MTKIKKRSRVLPLLEIVAIIFLSMCLVPAPLLSQVIANDISNGALAYSDQDVQLLIKDEQPHECRFWGIIAADAPSSVIEDHLVNLPNSIKNLAAANPDGWSVGYYPDGTTEPIVLRGYPPANIDPDFDSAVFEAADATPRIAVSHIRNTSSGVTPLAGNPHPFERIKNGKHWLMGHNGTIDKNVLLKLIRPDYFAANPPLYGSNQSEWIDTDLYQLFVLQTVEDFNWQVKPALAYVISRLHERIGPSTSPSTAQLNFFLTDGINLWGYREGNTLWYLDETTSPTPYSALASQPPSDSPGSWVAMNDGQLITMYQDAAPEVENISAYTAGEVIVDNDDPGTSYAGGAWGYSSGLDPYDGSSRAESRAGATYTFQRTMMGNQVVSLWWTYWSSRCTAVPVDIYDGNTLLDTVPVDQQQSSLASKWNVLGSYTFTGTARVVIRAQSGCSANADAVSFFPALAPDLDYIEIEGPASVNENSSVDYTCRAYYTDGSSRVVEPDWSENSTYATISSKGLLTTTEVASSQPCRISATYSENGIDLIDDFDMMIQDYEPPAEVIIDNDDPGTSYAGGPWGYSSGLNPYDGSSRAESRAGATYTFQKAMTGDQVVSLWWTYWSSRCSAVPVDIYDGNTLLDTVTVNQHQLNLAGDWNVLGPYTFTGTARVVIRAQNGCSACADAVKFESAEPPELSSIIITGPASVNENSSVAYTCTAYYTDGSSHAVQPIWSEDPDSAYATISSMGLLTTSEVESNEPCRILATFSENGITQSDDHNIVIQNYDPPDLDHIEIAGPDSVNENSSADYSCMAYYTDGSSHAVQPNWSENSDFATISSTGLLTTIEVGSTQFCNISATYTENDITRVDDHAIIIENYEPPAEVIIDNDDPGTSYAGGPWGYSSGLNPYDGSSRAESRAGATYTFQKAMTGDQVVSLWWTYWSSRCSAVPVDIYDGNTLLDTVTVNQHQLNLAGDWNVLGPYTFTGTARVVIRAQSSCSACADAVKFESAGPSLVTVPECVNIPQASAQSLITGIGLVMGSVSTANHATIVAGNVISTTPAGGTEVPEGSSVDLVVSLGPAPVTIPDVGGLNQGAAEAAIVAAGLTVGTVTTAPSVTVPAGDVISQSPIAGISVPPGTNVDLVVSSGPALVSVPTCVGLTRTAAEAAIVAAGLAVGTVTEQYDGVVPTGIVMDEEPDAGTMVVPLTPVDLVVSLGPEPVPVPPCMGLTRTAAEAAIVSAGLTVGTVTLQYDDTVPAGIVMDEEPDAGTLVAPSTPVDLLVSDGPAPVTVPDVVGDDEATAVAAIEALGLTANVSYAYSETVAAGLVISQDPADGTSVPAGSTVDLVVSLGPAPTDLVTDTDFSASVDGDDLRADGTGRDWYESRNDVPTLLDLNVADIGGNSTKKASLLNYGIAKNAYLTQEFIAPQTGVFAVSFDIFIDRIEDSGNLDRSGNVYIGDNRVSASNPPTGTSDERFVCLGFYDATPDTSGDDLEIRARTLSGQSFSVTSAWVPVASGLSYDNWYTVQVVMDAGAGVYDVYVDGVLYGQGIPKYSGFTAASLTHISFVADSDARGDFYVDNVQEVPLVAVPNCVDAVQAAAESLIAGAGLTVGSATLQNDDTIIAGNVISTTPAGGTEVPVGATVDLFVSTGPAPVTVPDVVGDDEATAVAAIEALGLTANVSYAYSETVAAGLVISQDPADGTSVPAGSTVDLVVSLGPAPTDLVTDTDFSASVDGDDLRADGTGRDWYESRNDVPTLLDLNVADIGGNSTKKASLLNYGIAKNAYLTQEFIAPQTGVFAVSFDIFIDRIEDSGNLDRSGNVYIGDNRVSASNPPTGTSDERFVCLGFYDATPDTSGDDLEIRARTLSGQSFSVTSAWVPVASGLSYDNWYTVQVVMDAGAGVYDVYVDGVLYGQGIPKYSGFTAASLTHISFVADSDARGDFYVDNVQEVPLVAVPNCVDAVQAAAESLIAGAGLTVGSATLQNDDTIIAGNVISTTPAGGTEVPVGATVDLFVSTGPAPVTVPDVVGDDEATAVAAIEALGLTANVSYAYSETVAAGLVISQDPAGGSGAIPGSTVVDIVVSLGPEPTDLVVDSDFEASGGVDPSADLRYNDPAIRDWYESRNDVPTLLFLDESDIGGNTEKKAGFTGSDSGNAYLSQELSSPQTGIFSIQWNIYVDNILDLATNPDRTGWMLIGDDSSTVSTDIGKGPNSTGSERFVCMAFYKEGGGDTGTMDLVAREPGQAWDGGSFTKVASGLNLDQWYTIKVTCDVASDTYMVYVDGVYQQTLTGFTSKDSLTHISFATWNDGGGDFYVDDVMEVESTLYSLTITPSDNGTVTLFPPGGIYPDGALVTLHPVPNAGWAFQEWDGDLDGGANPATITMEGDKTITPVFVAAPDVALHLYPTLLDFGSETDVLTMDIQNNGEEPFDWTALADQPWVVDIDPPTSASSGSLGPGESIILQVTVDRNLIGSALPDTNCRMWGAISSVGVPTSILGPDLISAPYSLKNLTSATSNNDGWSVAHYFEFGDHPVIERGPEYAAHSIDYDDAVNAMAALSPKIALAHVRNCTSGCCDDGQEIINDPHPFYREKNGKTWLFMHNGSINKTTLRNLIGEAYLAANPPNGSGIPQCDPDDFDLVVDSELYFLLVLKNIEANNWSVEKGIIKTIEDLGSASSINFLMSDGYAVWGFRRGQDLAYYHNASLGYSAVASQPPDGSGSGWTIMKDNELVILRPMATPELINVIDFARY